MNELNDEKETVSDCPILYQMRYRPCTETCMCWGWEFDKGWNRAVRDASYELEGINALVYPKYRVRIQADQIKQKYGDLCFYYSVVIDRGIIRTWIEKVFSRIDDYLFYTKNKKPWKTTLRKMVNKIGGFICYTWSEPSKEQIVISRLVEVAASQIIHKAEKECDNTCEKCGTQVGTHWSPRCITQGWISVLCKECAEKLEQNYEMNGKLMNGKTEVAIREN